MTGDSSPALLAEALDRLHRAGWSLGVVALGSTDGSGRVVWQVDGCNGENIIRSAGATEAEAWPGAMDQASEVGMLGGLRKAAERSWGLGVRADLVASPPSRAILTFVHVRAR